MEETISPYQSQQQKSNKILPTIIVVAVLVAAFAGWFFITQQPKKTDKVDDVVIEKKEPSPTEKPKIEKTSVKIQVINGTGTPGQAGVVVTALEDAGYNSENIKTGNADKYDNATTSITARSNFEEIVNDIKNVLKATFDKITIISPNLDENSEFDVVIVTGGKIFEAVTPTTSITDSENPTPTTTITPTSSPTPTP
jgi:hypothetical protein